MAAERLRPRAMRRLLALFAAGCLLLAAACSRAERHRWLAFFFDGVPPPEGQTPAPAKPAPISRVTGMTQTVLNRAAPPPAIRSNHEPYSQRQCGRCHRVDQPALLVAETRSLCLGCHGQRAAEERWSHGPAVVGACDVCHLPHQSVHPALLRRTDDAMCYECHLDEDLRENPAHRDTGDLLCISCHDAHIVERWSVAQPGREGPKTF